MKCFEIMGLIEWVGDLTVEVVSIIPEGKIRLLVAVLIIINVSGIVSGFIDNIPYVATLVPVIVKLSQSKLGLPLAPLVWSLALGACLGGNMTIIGASANVVAVGLAERNGYKIGFLEFLKIGFPITLISMVISSIYMVITHVLIEWY